MDAMVRITLRWQCLRQAPRFSFQKHFTPNGDGLNDQIYPICVGIKQLNFFRIYNRWGQLIFSTSQMNKGWDGTISGIPQGTNNFVFMAQGVDYLGHVIFKRKYHPDSLKTHRLFVNFTIQTLVSTWQTHSINGSPFLIFCLSHQQRRLHRGTLSNPPLWRWWGSILSTLALPRSITTELTKPSR